MILSRRDSPVGESEHRQGLGAIRQLLKLDYLVRLLRFGELENTVEHPSGKNNDSVIVGDDEITGIHFQSGKPDRHAC